MLLAGPISHTGTQYIDYVEILNILLDLSTIYFAHFSGCCASFVYSCHSILECCNVFWSQVEYKIVCFISLRVLYEYRNFSLLKNNSLTATAKRLLRY